MGLVGLVQGWIREGMCGLLVVMQLCMGQPPHHFWLLCSLTGYCTPADCMYVTWGG